MQVPVESILVNGVEWELKMLRVCSQYDDGTPMELQLLVDDCIEFSPAGDDRFIMAWVPITVLGNGGHDGPGEDSGDSERCVR